VPDRRNGEPGIDELPRRYDVSLRCRELMYTSVHFTT
jgi:hypothetical protein